MTVNFKKPDMQSILMAFNVRAESSMSQAPSHIDLSDKALFQQCCQDIACTGLAQAMNGWLALDFTTEQLTVAREAVLAHKMNDTKDVVPLIRLVPKGYYATDVLQHTVEVAARGTPHALTWARALTRVAPWAAESLAGQGQWLGQILSLPGTTQRMSSRSWHFLWKAMAQRWIHGDLVAQRGGQDVGSDQELMALAMVADLAGEGLVWSHHVAHKLDARLGQCHWNGEDQQVYAHRLLARVRRQLLGGLATTRDSKSTPRPGGRTM